MDWFWFAADALWFVYKEAYFTNMECQKCIICMHTNLPKPVFPVLLSVYYHSCETAALFTLLLKPAIPHSITTYLHSTINFLKTHPRWTSITCTSIWDIGFSSWLQRLLCVLRLLLSHSMRYIDVLVQERRQNSALAMDLRPSCIKPSTG